MKKHHPTKAMQDFAKRGLAMTPKGERKGPDLGLAIGRKIASGSELSSDHVRQIEITHSGHDCSGDDAGCALMGGPAGATWAAGRVNMMDAESTATSERRSIEQMIEDGALLSYEVFVRENLGEPVYLDEDDKDGLIWAPILRSGTHATRPGPNGEKIHEPLVFVSGHASDPRKEIGLQDLVDAFDEQAVEYVTIPKTHDNDLLDNTGFIRALKIVDSKRKPGEKVLVAAHDFTEPDIREKTVRGTIPSRSCGILYDYTNTETGETYPQVLEHVALTSKPWVRGMTPYGQLSSGDFSEREVLSMLLSDGPLRASKDSEKPKVPGKLVPLSTSTPSKQLERITKLTDVLWDDAVSLRSVEAQVAQILQGMRSQGGESYGAPYYSVLDVAPDKVLVSCDYGYGSDNDAWVVPYSMEDDEVILSNFADWKPVEQQWVLDEDANEDVSELENELNPPPQSADLSEEERLALEAMTAEQRKKLPKTAFVFPDKAPGSGSYPIHDLAHGKVALARSSGKPEEAAVKAAVHKRYPQLKKTSMADDPLKRASENRKLGLAPEQRPNQPGGRMSRIDEAKLDALGLSDEAKALFRQQETDLEQAKEAGKEGNKAKVKARLAELSEAGFKGLPGVLKVAEEVYLSDDGDVAVSLKLADEQGKVTTTPTTATEVVDRILNAFIPEGKDKVDFSEQGNLLESPLSTRPELEPNKGDKPQTGDDLQKFLSEHAPEFAATLSSDARNDSGKDGK